MESGRTKSDFRALREMVGMTQATLAHTLDVKVLSVKRWENPDNQWSPPEDAWSVLDDARERQKKMVNAAIEQVEKTVEEIGCKPETVDLTYWHSSDDFDRAHPGEGWGWQMANATARLTADRLEEMGYVVRFGFGGLESLDTASYI